MDRQFLQATVVPGDTTLSFTSPPHAGGSVTITVVNPDGKSSNGLTLTYGTISTQPVMVHTPATIAAGRPTDSELLTVAVTVACSPHTDNAPRVQE